jgi:hypothetical protein
MVRSCTIFAGLALAACAAGVAAHLFLGLSRADAGVLAAGGVLLALLYAVTLPWRRRRTTPQQQTADPQAPSNTVLAYRIAELERRLAELEVRVAAANLDAAEAPATAQDPMLRARARAELARAAAAIERQ